MSTMATLPRHSHKKRLCACGCGQEVTGQRSKKFVSDSHRKRFNRSGRVLESTQRPRTGQESRTPPESATGTPDVRALDTEAACAACGCPMPKIYGRLQVSVYCADCVGANRCPCGSRPAWHQFGRSPGKARAA